MNEWLLLVGANWFIFECALLATHFGEFFHGAFKLPKKLVQFFGVPLFIWFNLYFGLQWFSSDTYLGFGFVIFGLIVFPFLFYRWAVYMHRLFVAHQDTLANLFLISLSAAFLFLLYGLAVGVLIPPFRIVKLVGIGDPIMDFIFVFAATFFTSMLIFITLGQIGSKFDIDEVRELPNERSLNNENAIPRD